MANCAFVLNFFCNICNIRLKHNFLVFIHYRAPRENEIYVSKELSEFIVDLAGFKDSKFSGFTILGKVKFPVHAGYPSWIGYKVIQFVR